MSEEELMLCDTCALDHWEGFSHCPDCHRSWEGNAQAHCASCHQHFSSNSAFDRHTGLNGCSDPRRLRDRSGKQVLKKVRLKEGYSWCLYREEHGFSNARRHPRGLHPVPVGAWDEDDE